MQSKCPKMGSAASVVGQPGKAFPISQWVKWHCASGFERAEAGFCSGQGAGCQHHGPDKKAFRMTL